MSELIRKRVLEAVPEPVRRIFEAENEMRRMFTSAETSYADLEGVAVLNGVMPASESEFIIPADRWSYHPAGFFIRFKPEHYSRTRVEIYYPQSVQLRRDESGKIISIASAGARRIDITDEVKNAATLVSSSDDMMKRARIAIIENAMRVNATGDARRDLLMLAELDYLELTNIQKNLEVIATRSRSTADRARADLVREAVHASLARFIGLSRSERIDRGSPVESSMRPKRLGAGYTYIVATVSSKRGGGGFGRYGPAGGGAVAPGSRQRLGLGAPPFLSGSPDPMPPEPDALDKAIKMTGALDNANNLLGAFSDPAGMLGGFPGGWMMGQGLDAAFDNARQIGNALSGEGGMASTGFLRGRDVAFAPPPEQPMILPVSLRTTRMIGAPVYEMASGNLDDDYKTLARPRTITFTPLTAKEISPARANIINSAIATSLRMAMALESWIITNRRLAAAITAEDLEWQETQGRALLYLKRTAGKEMLQLASELAALKAAVPETPIITEEEVTEAQRRLTSDGVPREAVAIATQIGRSPADVEKQRQRVLALDPKTPPVQMAAAIQNLQETLEAYGSHLVLLPEVAPPWK